MPIWKVAINILIDFYVAALEYSEAVSSGTSP